MRNLFFFAVGFFLAFTLGIATSYAGTLVRLPDGELALVQTALDGTKTYSSVEPSRTAGLQADVKRILGNQTIGPAQGARVPVTLEVAARKALSKDVLAKAAIKNLRRGAGVATAVGIVADVIGSLDLEWDPTCQCFRQGVPTPSQTVPSEYRTAGTPFFTGSTPQAAVNAYNAAVFPAYYSDAYNNFVFSNPRNWTGTSQTVTVTMTRKSNGVVTTTNDTWGEPSVFEYCSNSTATLNSTSHTCTIPAVPASQITEQQAIDGIKLANPPWPDFLEDLSRDPNGGVDTTEAGPATPEVSLPQNSPNTLTPTPDGAIITTPKNVRDNGDGTRTEEETKVTTKTQGDTITYNIQNTTKIINNTTNQTVSTSTEENDGADLSGSYTDTPLGSPDLLVDMPEVPDFYEQKYPGGFGGEWDSFKTAIDQTPFFGLIDQLTPNWTGGQCPSWSMSFNWGFVDLGTHVIEPPCWIFPILKIIVMVTALFVARGLVFGG